MRRAIAAQATALVVGGLVLGAPLGVVIDRTVWRVVADRLGVSTSPTVPVTTMLILVPAALGAGALMAWYPGRSASRRGTVESLRAE